MCVTRIDKNKIETFVYSKATNTNIYINWLFHVNHIFDQELLQTLEVEVVKTKNHNTEQKIQVLLPHSGKQGHQLASKANKQFERTLPDDIKRLIGCKSRKLSTKFPVKDKTYFPHRHNVGS